MVAPGTLTLTVPSEVSPHISPKAEEAPSSKGHIHFQENLVSLGIELQTTAGPTSSLCPPVGLHGYPLV